MSFAFLPDRQSWLEWRRQGLGSSDAAAVAGLDPWRGPMRVYLDKIGELEDHDREFEYQRWGQLLEPTMIQEFERRTDLFVTQRQASLVHPVHEWMRATVDGIVIEGQENFANVSIPRALGVYEAKTSAGFKDAQWADGVPDHYRIQVMHQLAVTGLDHAWIAVLHGGNRFEIYELDRDDKQIALLEQIEGTFWFENVIARQPPDVDGLESTTRALQEAFRIAQAGKTIDLGEDGATLLDNLRFAREQRAAAEHREERAKQAVMARLGTAEAGLVEGRLAVTWKEQKSTRIDLETLRNQEPEVARRFEKVTTGRGALRLIGEK